MYYYTGSTLRLTHYFKANALWDPILCESRKIIVVEFYEEANFE